MLDFSFSGYSLVYQGVGIRVPGTTNTCLPCAQTGSEVYPDSYLEGARGLEVCGRGGGAPAHLCLVHRSSMHGTVSPFTILVHRLVLD